MTRPGRLTEIACTAFRHLRASNPKADSEAVTRYLRRYRLTPAEHEAARRVVLDLLVEALTLAGRPPMPPATEKH